MCFLELFGVGASRFPWRSAKVLSVPLGPRRNRESPKCHQSRQNNDPMIVYRSLLWPYKSTYAYGQVSGIVPRGEQQQEQQQLRLRSMSDAKERKFVCIDCGKAYAVHRSLWRHRKFECVNAKPKFACEVCPYTSPHKWCIDNHKKRHHSDAYN
ncbi:uncharacterized protein LOC143376379 [Andrena cerasifolii]|uniref:uncharacterized protein LOC143376379 n=1 Tax=Andrena cerasifolii TaxID=2819439 RepID=UPI0040380351